MASEAPTVDPNDPGVGVAHFNASPLGTSFQAPSYQTAAPAPAPVTAPAAAATTGPTGIPQTGVAPAQHAPGDDADTPASGKPAPNSPAAAPDPAGSRGSGGDGSTQAPSDPGDPTTTPIGSGGIGSAPIELDLSGDGIAVTQLTSSNTYEPIDRDGYRHRTAWAGAGDAVLFVDPNGLGTIRDADQYVFTDWDPSATSDLQALRDVFDTDHDGSLDAGDAAFGSFRLMVTEADGTTRVETLAEAGIASVGLTADAVTQGFADGSSIDGETRFTRTDGTTGTAASVTYAADARGYAVQTATSVGADGATTVDNRALDADGRLAGETTSTTSADGLSRTIAYDDAGDGVVDRVQTDVTAVAADGGRTETVSDYDGQGALEDATTTTTSADRGTVVIARDLDGGGIVRRRETRQTGADGSVTDTLAELDADGSAHRRTVTTTSADGLDRQTSVDVTGDGAADSLTDDRTTVGPDGSRTETIRATAADRTVTGPDGCLWHVSIYPERIAHFSRRFNRFPVAERSHLSHHCSIKG